jgi:hypothetical protein
MIKARMKDMLIIGLSDENIKRLKEGKLILFRPSEIGFGEIPINAVMIMAGKIEKEMREDFVGKGYITRRTKILGDPDV